MKISIRKNIERGVIFGFICAVMLSFAKFETRFDELRAGVLRLHILANSDSYLDQQLKLKVRDRILEVTSQKFSEAEDIDGAIKIAEQNIDFITDSANEVIKENGFDYKAEISVEKNFFENRVYDDFTLPAGVYNSLTVRIGKAKGHNWWCVVFPGVCLPAAEKTRLNKAVSDKSATVAENASKYKICFKTAEVYEKLKNKISKK